MDTDMVLVSIPRLDLTMSPSDKQDTHVSGFLLPSTIHIHPAQGPFCLALSFQHQALGSVEGDICPQPPGQWGIEVSH